MADKYAYMANAGGFVFDWRETWTKRVCEEQLEGFEFKGPGWYLYEDDAMLVVPAGLTMPKTGEPSEEQFDFFVWNGRNPAQAFNEIVNAPTRLDERC